MIIVLVEVEKGEIRFEHTVRLKVDLLVDVWESLIVEHHVEILHLEVIEGAVIFRLVVVSCLLYAEYEIAWTRHLNTQIDRVIFSLWQIDRRHTVIVIDDGKLVSIANDLEHFCAKAIRRRNQRKHECDFSVFDSTLEIL